MDHWLDSIEIDNEELRTDQSLRRFNSLEEALKGHVELRGIQGRSIAVPGTEAGKEDWEKFDSKLMEKIPGLVRMPKAEEEEDVGRFWGQLDSLPITEREADSYQVPEGLDALGDDQVTGLRAAAAQAGMTPKQFEKFITIANQENVKIQEAATAAKEADDALATKIFGAAKEEKFSISDTILEKFEDKDAPLGDFKAVFQTAPARALLVNLAKSLTSDPQVFNQINNPTPAKTPSELREDADSIRTQLLQRDISPARRKELLGKQVKIYETLERYG